MTEKLHISIKAEEIFSLGGMPITNSYLASIMGLALFLIIAVTFFNNRNNTKSNSAFFIRFITTKLYDLFFPIFGERTEKFFPLVGSIFAFVLLSNWIGLIPGVGSLLVETGHGEKVPLLRAATADLNTTTALALIAFVSIQYYGVFYLGIFGYIRKFINLSSPVNLFSGLLEVVSELSKIISFTFRLFGNIFAGEVLIAVIAFLIPVLASFPFLLLEIFVGLIQALVFALLTAVFINLAIAKHH